MFWFHFCYLPDDVWKKYREHFPNTHIDTQVKAWIYQDFNLKMLSMEDVYTAKDLIKKLYAEVYPDVYLPGCLGDRQGWSRVWLTGKITSALEAQHG